MFILNLHQPFLTLAKIKNIDIFCGLDPEPRNNNIRVWNFSGTSLGGTVPLLLSCFCHLLFSPLLFYIAVMYCVPDFIFSLFVLLPFCQRLTHFTAGHGTLGKTTLCKRCRCSCLWPEAFPFQWPQIMVPSQSSGCWSISVGIRSLPLFNRLLPSQAQSFFSEC